MYWLRNTDQLSKAIQHRFVDFLLPRKLILGISDSIQVCLHSDIMDPILDKLGNTCI